MDKVLLDVVINDECILIKDSYKVTNDHTMYRILKKAMEHPAYKKYGYNRKMSNYIAEWKIHNLCYKLHICRSRTKDVNLDRVFKKSFSSKLQQLVYNIFDGLYEFYDVYYDYQQKEADKKDK